MRLKLPRRYVAVFLIVLVAKSSGGMFLYYALNFSSTVPYWMDPARAPPWEQNAVLTDNMDPGSKWEYLFLGWDSAWYLSIAEKGYSFSSQSYTFFPGLPIFTEGLSFFTGSPILSIVAITLFFGVAWVPLFQLVAERYLDKRTAMASTLLTAFFPFVFLFTTVAYGEGLFLFFTLGAWLSFQRGRSLYAGIWASLATAVRPAGFVLTIPLILGALRNRAGHWVRDTLLGCLPLVTYCLWWAFSGIISNDLLAPIHTTEWSGMSTFSTSVFDLIKTGSLGSISTGVSDQNWLAVCFIWVIIFLVPFLIYRVVKMDRTLGTYSIIYYLGVLASGGLASVPRFLAFLFPAGIAPFSPGLFERRWLILLFVIVIASFYLMGLYLWAAFLTGEFVA